MTGKRKYRDAAPEPLPTVGELISYLLEATDAGVRAVELARLQEGANLERQIRGDLGRLAQLHAEAMTCRLVLEVRARPRAARLPVGRLLGS